MSQVKQRKVALMGFRSVGKSSLAIQFVQVKLKRSRREVSVCLLNRYHIISHLREIKRL